MLQITRDCPFPVAMAAIPNADGVDAMQVVIQGTFAIWPGVAVADAQAPVGLSDRHHDDDPRRSLLQAGAMQLLKPGTDVVLVGQAHADGGEPATQAAVRLAVAERSRTVAVFGDRTWQARGKIGEPKRFTTMPLTYERAFGGAAPSQRAADLAAAERNPAGVGLLAREGTPLPNLEDAGQLIAGPKDRPDPAAFGPIAPGWEPRRSLAGTYDEPWARRRAPYLPTDFDPSFLRCAAGPMAFDRYLEGGERIEIIGASARGRLEFALPRCSPHVGVRVDGCWETAPPPHLVTVELRPEDDAMTLTWHTEVDGDRRLLKIEEVHVSLDGEEALAS